MLLKVCRKDLLGLSTEVMCSGSDSINSLTFRKTVCKLFIKLNKFSKIADNFSALRAFWQL